MFLTQLLRIMRITAILLLAVGLHVSGNTVSQTITFSGKGVTLREVFTAVRDQTNFGIIYNKSWLGDSKPLTITAVNQPLKEFLEKIFATQPLDFSIEGKMVIVKKKPPITDSLNHQLLSPSLTAPPITVRGRIVNEKGEPVIASVLVKGTNIGVTADAEGNFLLNSIDNNATLIISGISIETQEMKLNGQSIIVINVTTKINSEDEVVINGGYYKTNKITKTGNISRVDGKDIERQPVTSPLMALQGRAAGVDVFQTSGAPGGGTTIRIRGQNSLRFDGGYPLYVVDGVLMDGAPVQSSAELYGSEYDPLRSINPADIASIEVLKDADATSIYGSRGANGVVLITTRKANGNGKTAIDLSIYRGMGQVSKKLDVLNTQEYLSMRREAFKNNNEVMNEYSAPDFFIWDTTRYTDWQDVLLGGTSQITDAQASILSGNANTSFRFSSGYHKETTIFPGNFYYERFTGSLSVNHMSSNKRFRANFSANYGATKNHIFDGTQPISKAYTLSPNAPDPYNNDGSLNWAPYSSGGPSWENPIAAFLLTNDSKGNNLVFNGTLGYNITNDILVKTNFGYTNLNNSEVLRKPLSRYSPAFAIYFTPESRSTTTQRSSWITEPQIVYNKKFNVHQLDIVAGATFQQGTNDYKSIEASKYSSDGLLGSLRGANKIDIIGDDNYTYRYTAVFARIGYDYREKYLINLTARRDGSSKFGTNNRFADFGAVGAAWIFSKEKFVADHFSFINLGKLRGSIGTTGNDQIGDYRYTKTFQTTSLQYRNVYGLLSSSLFNPDFQWEVTKKIEAAAELSFFKGRINVEIAWYRNHSSNLLIDYQLPGTSGLGTVLTNLDATVENRGWEYTASAELINKDDFRWSISANYSRPRNELTRFDDLPNSTYANQYVVGSPLDVLKLYNFTGIDPQTGEYTYLDVDGNGFLDDADKTTLKSKARSYFGGVQNSINFKGVEFSVLFQFVKLASDKLMTQQMPGQVNNLPRSLYESRWRIAGDIAAAPKLNSSFSFPFIYYASSDGFYENASFFRLKTLSLSYSLPEYFINRIGLNSCRIYTQGQNLFTLTNYSGLDPETGNFNLPPLRMISLGIQLGI